MLRNQSTYLIEAPEFIHLEPNALNPNITACEIKVCYLGANRNNTYIDKAAIMKMAQTLPGTPIVGVYRKELEDFGDHGKGLSINDDGEIVFTSETVPYGFVSPNAKVWLQKYQDVDENGESVIRTYLMTTGFLWTGQYPEITKCITEGMGQSMEIDVNQGTWETDSDLDLDLYIVHDASFNRLCVLGDSVEPCFEGASITALSKENAAYNNATDFTLQNVSLQQNLFTMMNELRDMLQHEEGVEMAHTILQVQDNTSLINVPEEKLDDIFVFEKKEQEEVAKTDTKAKSADDEKDDATDAKDKTETTKSEDDEADVAKEDQAKKDEKNKYELQISELQQQLTELQQNFAALSEEAAGLRAFKQEREDADKDALIARYFMLSDEEKADIIAHKTDYSLQEIEAQLALLYVNTKVDFNVEEVEEHEDSPVTSFNLETDINYNAEDDEILNALRTAQQANL